MTKTVNLTESEQIAKIERFGILLSLGDPRLDEKMAELVALGELRALMEEGVLSKETLANTLAKGALPTKILARLQAKLKVRKEMEGLIAAGALTLREVADMRDKKMSGEQVVAHGRAKQWVREKLAALPAEQVAEMRAQGMSDGQIYAHLRQAKGPTRANVLEFLYTKVERQVKYGAAVDKRAWQQQESVGFRRLRR